MAPSNGCPVRGRQPPRIERSPSRTRPSRAEADWVRFGSWRARLVSAERSGARSLECHWPIRSRTLDLATRRTLRCAPRRAPLSLTLTGGSSGRTARGNRRRGGYGVFPGWRAPRRDGTALWLAPTAPAPPLETPWLLSVLLFAIGMGRATTGKS